MEKLNEFSSKTRMGKKPIILKKAESQVKVMRAWGGRRQVTLEEIESGIRVNAD